MHTTPPCDRHDRSWVNELLGRMPHSFAKEAARRYGRTFRSTGRFAANTALRETAEVTSRSSVRITASDEELRSMADARAKACRRLVTGLPLRKAFRTARRYTAGHGIPLDFLERPNVTPQSALARMQDPIWWRRRLRRIHVRGVERAAIQLNMVCRTRAAYVSDEALASFRGRKRRNRELLEFTEATNELGDTFTLQQLSDKGVSNPVNRRNELMTRLSGLETIANESGHVGEFYTFTCPSRFHATLYDGTPNPRYAGNETPESAQRYMTTLWARMRSKLQRSGIPLYGIRVVEPHHDGTPHWHLLVFMPADSRNEVRNVFRNYLLTMDGDEPGAAENRFDAKEIDPSKGSAAGYVAKYISKNINGAADVVGDDLEAGTDAATGAERVEAWARTWGIRQFQFFGSPPVSPWREFRKISGNDLPESETLVSGFSAADSGNWSAYCHAMGGVCRRRGDWLVQTVSRKATGNLETTGEIRLNQYGELAADQIVGVQSGESFVQTRLHTWTISTPKRPTRPIAPEPLRMQELATAWLLLPWSSVNNCTHTD